MRAHHDFGHDVLSRAHVILRVHINSDLYVFIPLSFDFGTNTEGYVELLRISYYFTNCTISR